MNHPEREEWVPYLFGEAKPETRHRLQLHLQGCAECRGELETWQSSLNRLDAWKLPPAPWAAQNLAPFLRWAAAAVILLLLSFGAGRLSAAKADAGKLRAMIEPKIRAELGNDFAQVLRQEVDRAAAATLALSNERTEQLLATFARAIESGRAEDRQAIFAAMEKLESQRVADCLSLKKEIDTIAVNTDAGLRQTEQQLVQLADYTRPVNP